MMGKSILITFLMVTVASATGPGPAASSFDFTAQSKAVVSICDFATDKSLCCKALKSVQSDNPKDLVTGYVSVTATAMNKSLLFLDQIRPKYKSDDTSATCLDVCTKQLNYAMQDLATFKTKAGNDIKSLETNYSELMQLVRGVYTYTSDCLDDITDENFKKVVGDGIAEGRNMSSNAVDIFYKLSDVFAKFGLQVNLV